jgi:hypothetical protein
MSACGLKVTIRFIRNNLSPYNYILDGWDSILGSNKRFSLLRNSQTGYGAHQYYYMIGIKRCLIGENVVGA